MHAARSPWTKFKAWFPALCMQHMQCKVLYTYNACNARFTQATQSPKHALQEK